jgi:hypothetical protein
LASTRTPNPGCAPFSAVHWLLVSMFFIFQEFVIEVRGRYDLLLLKHIKPKPSLPSFSFFFNHFNVYYKNVCGEIYEIEPIIIGIFFFLFIFLLAHTQSAQILAAHTHYLKS